MIRLYLWLQSHLRSTIESDRGQSTAEYALVLLGAAAIALLLVAWATKTNRIGKLLDFVVDQIIGRVT
jgi:hypothetical protein